MDSATKVQSVVRHLYDESESQAAISRHMSAGHIVLTAEHGRFSLAIEGGFNDSVMKEILLVLAATLEKMCPSDIALAKSSGRLWSLEQTSRSIVLTKKKWTQWLFEESELPAITAWKSWLKDQPNAKSHRRAYFD